MEYNQSYQYANSSGTPNGFGLLTIIYVFIGLIAIYFLYRYLYINVDNKSTILVGGKRAGDSSPDKLPTIPTPYEGGDYSFSTWIYVSSFNKNRNARKHLFELQGKYFSTLLVGLGAFKNTLFVRTHTNDPSVEGFQAANGITFPITFSDLKHRANSQMFQSIDGFQAGTGAAGTGAAGTGAAGTGAAGTGAAGTGAAGTGAAGTGAAGTGAAGTGAAGTGAAGTGATATKSVVPPNASDKIGNLSATMVSSMFAQLAMGDELLDTPPICDLPEIDLQRWTMITVVLSGRTIDVYLDGKLSRSCMGASFYKVDPTGVKPVLTDRGGFDGYTGQTYVANYAMNPDEIYRAYLAGPDGGGSMDFFGWFISLFKGGS